MDPELAIVIPAFKARFLSETLESISKQTDARFKVYVGDDGSTESLKEIVDVYADILMIRYKRFDHNLGAFDLVSHWHRCIDMVESEKWLWLFSDDDIMEPNCVENFYRELSGRANFDIYHFNVIRIDSEGRVILNESKFPQTFKTDEFVRKLIQFEITSYIVEYIFKIERLRAEGGFQNFDLAWGSDHATCIKVSIGHAIRTVEGSFVKWRLSGYNVTANINDEGVSKRKRAGEIQFFEWLVRYYAEKGFAIPFSSISASRWLAFGIAEHTRKYGFSSLPGWCNKISLIEKGGINRIQIYFFVLLYFAIALIKAQRQRYLRLFKL